MCSTQFGTHLVKVLVRTGDPPTASSEVVAAAEAAAAAAAATAAEAAAAVDQAEAKARELLDERRPSEIEGPTEGVGVATPPPQQQQQAGPTNQTALPPYVPPSELVPPWALVSDTPPQPQTQPSAQAQPAQPAQAQAQPSMQQAQQAQQAQAVMQVQQAQQKVQQAQQAQSAQQAASQQQGLMSAAFALPTPSGAGSLLSADEQASSTSERQALKGATMNTVAMVQARDQPSLLDQQEKASALELRLKVVRDVMQKFQSAPEGMTEGMALLAREIGRCEIFSRFGGQEVRLQFGEFPARQECKALAAPDDIAFTLVEARDEAADRGSDPRHAIRIEAKLRRQGERFGESAGFCRYDHNAGFSSSGGVQLHNIAAVFVAMVVVIVMPVLAFAMLIAIGVIAVQFIFAMVVMVAVIVMGFSFGNLARGRRVSCTASSEGENERKRQPGQFCVGHWVSPSNGAAPIRLRRMRSATRASRRAAMTARRVSMSTARA